MLTRTPYIVKMFEFIAYDVQQQTGVQVHYQHGHPQEIDDTLQAWSKTPDNSGRKYPLIALFQDFDERRGVGAGVMAEINVDILIATMTRPELTASQRMAISFVPLLYPLYNQFVESVCRSGYFMGATPTSLQHTKTDRMFWGRNKAAAFGDYVDAIHIQKMKLNVKKLNCK